MRAVSKGYESCKRPMSACDDGADLRVLSKLKHLGRADSPYLAVAMGSPATAVEGAPILSTTRTAGSHGTQPKAWLTLL